MSLLFEPALATLSVVDSPQAFPVGRVLCVGRNYAAHAQEMGGSGAEPPFFFMKPASSVWDIAREGSAWPYPMGTQDCHHELEIVLAIGPDSRVLGLALGLDMTRRDRQSQMKAQGKPWEVGKAFRHAAPTTPLSLLSSLGWSEEPERIQARINDAELTLCIDGEVRQAGRPSQMLCPIPALLQQIQSEFGLLPGDLIFTGTPSGVGPVHPGQALVGKLDQLLPALHLQVHHSLQEPL